MTKVGYRNPKSLVSTGWLAEHLGAPGMRVVDATAFLPGAGRDAGAEFERRHIPGAVHFDIDDVCDGSSGLPHMLPDVATFAARVGALGIGDGDGVVVYDAHGGYLAACRVWWMFRAFGHPHVAVLDGGLPRWTKEGRPVEDGPADPLPRTLTARLDAGRVRNACQLLAGLTGGREQVVDARSPGRFAGTDPEPRPTRKAGHIPGSVNVPVAALMRADADFAMRPADELVRAFAQAGVDSRRPVVATCGSGVTAAVIVFARHLLGRDDDAIYDGSWAEWGNRDDTPVER